MSHSPASARTAASLAVGVALWLSGAARLDAQATAVITGRVADAATAQPVANAQLGLVGTNRAAQSNAEGVYTLRGLTPGTYTVRVLRIGYTEQSQQVTVRAGQATTLNIALRAAAVNLAPVVATATGDQRRVEIGNSITSVDAAALVAERPVANMSDLLTGRTPGVVVLGSTSTGGGQRIRIRGASSLSLSNEPIVFIDGIRMTSDNNSASIGVGGTNPSRLSDLNPEDIESFEIVRGPSASTLYGTDAANGVIVIRTKRGKAGPARWNAYAERGGITDRNRYPDAVYGWTSNAPGTRPSSTASNNVQCFATQVSRRLCAQDSVTTYNLWNDDQASPLATGLRQQYGMNVGGGTDAAQYFVSGEWEDETGQYRMPELFRTRVLETRGISSLPRDQEYPNALRRTTVRANLNVIANPKTDFAVSTGFISSSQRLPQLDNNAGGLQSNGFGGPGFRANTTTASTPLYGFRLYAPDEIFAQNTTQAVNRWLGSGTGNWRPTSWLAGRFGGGLDYTSRNESNLCLRGQCTNLGINRQGFKINNRSEFFQYTLDGSLTATKRIGSVEGRTSAGVQYVRNYFQRNGASIENLAGGASQLSAGATNPQVAELATDSKTAGAYLQQTLGWRDVLFGTAAIRADKNSSFGAEFPAIVYPKADVSWIVSREGFFPRVRGLEQLRLRGAFGQSGRQPGTIDATRFYTPTRFADVGGDQPALVFSAIGNPDLRPEVTQEIEGGFEATLLGSRLTLDATYYSKTTRDALIDRVVSPSVGAAVVQTANLGAVKNAGLELLVNATVVDLPQFGFDFVINGTRNENKLVSLGAGTPPIIGATRRQIPGYPLNGLWQRRISAYGDANDDGIITANELTVDDNFSFIGREDPRTIVQLTPTVRLLRGKLRVAANFDRQTGFVRLNGTERIRCEARNNCVGAVSTTAPLWEQARAVAVREDPSRTQAGYMEVADFTRWRELSVAYDLPTRFARAVRAQGASVRVAGRNLRLWTNYSGIDPESNYFEGPLGTVSDFQTAPPPSLFTARVDLRF